MRKAFLLPLRAGTVAGGNGMGIFVRLPGGDDPAPGQGQHHEAPCVFAAAGSAADTADWTFLRDRVAKIRAFRGRAQRLWDSSILKMLLK